MGVPPLKEIPISNYGNPWKILQKVQGTFQKKEQPTTNESSPETSRWTPGGANIDTTHSTATHLEVPENAKVHRALRVIHRAIVTYHHW